MNEAALKERLRELGTLMRELFQPGAGEAADGLSLFDTELTGTTGTPEDVIESIRVQLKYILFDLEATRRENGYLRKMLERRHKPSGSQDPSEGTDGS